MDDGRAERIEDKLDKLIDQLGKTDRALTEILSTRPLYIDHINDLERRVVPLEKHANMVQGAGKLIGVAGVLVGILLGVYQVFK